MRKEKNTHFWIASERGDLETVKSELKDGVDVNATGLSDNTALHFASKKQWKPIVKLLLENGANPNIMNYQDQTPLHLAVVAGDKDIVRLLLEHGADPRIKGTLGHDAFHAAKFHHIDDTELMDILVKAAPPEAEQPKGWITRQFDRLSRKNTGGLPGH